MGTKKKHQKYKTHFEATEGGASAVGRREGGLGQKLGKDGNGNGNGNGSGDERGGIGISVLCGILIPWNWKLPNIITGQTFVLLILSK